MFPLSSPTSTIGRVVREPEPFGGDPIIGWRAWRLREDDDGWWLTSTYQPGGKGPYLAWPRLKAMEAECVRTTFGCVSSAGVPQHDAPCADHQCGIYALNKDDVERWACNNRRATGQVRLWGRIVVCEDGYRAQYAYPCTIRVFDADEDVAFGLSEAYGVPVEVL